MGLQLGGFFNWNSGTFASNTFLASGRNLPFRVPANAAFEYAGITERWIAPDSVGTLRNPGWGTFDLRVQYNRNLVDTMGVEFFVDLFNITNNQGAIREQDLVAGSGSNPYGSEIQWVTPRRAFIGARLKF
jgi:outer membrane receptor protein involved in Fe transport